MALKKHIQLCITQNPHTTKLIVFCLVQIYNVTRMHTFTTTNGSFLKRQHTIYRSPPTTNNISQITPIWNKILHLAHVPTIFNNNNNNWYKQNLQENNLINMQQFHLVHTAHKSQCKHLTSRAGAWGSPLPDDSDPSITALGRHVTLHDLPRL